MKEYEHKNKVVGTLPVLPVNNVAETLKYYKETLGFHELFSQTGENNILINSQVRFENNSLMLNYNPEEADKKGGGVFFWMRIEDRDIDEYYQDLCDKNVKIAGGNQGSILGRSLIHNY